MLIAPISEPAMLGVKVTLMLHVPPAGNGDDATQLSVSEKSPPAFTLNTLTAPLVTFVIVSCCGALLVPIVWLAKVKAEGSIG